MRGYRYGVSENTTAGSPYPMAPEKPCSGDAVVRGPGYRYVCRSWSACSTWQVIERISN